MQVARCVGCMCVSLCMMHVCQLSRCDTKYQCVVCMCVSGSDTLCVVCMCESDSHRHTLYLRAVCLSVTSFSVQGLVQGLGIRYRAVFLPSK
jgi:hypothetical protein